MVLWWGAYGLRYWAQSSRWVFIGKAQSVITLLCSAVAAGWHRWGCQIDNESEMTTPHPRISDSDWGVEKVFSLSKMTDYPKHVQRLVNFVFFPYIEKTDTTNGRLYDVLLGWLRIQASSGGYIYIPERKATLIQVDTQGRCRSVFEATENPWNFNPFWERVYPGICIYKPHLPLLSKPIPKPSKKGNTMGVEPSIS